jgi:hypothetical protein
MEYRINKWYRALLDLERKAFTDSADLKRRAESLRRLAHIEKSVSKMGVPAKFGNLLYGLREHIASFGAYYFLNTQTIYSNQIWLQTIMANKG